MAKAQSDDPFGLGMLGFDPYAAAAQAQADYAATISQLSQRTGPQSGPSGGYNPRYSSSRGSGRNPRTVRVPGPSRGPQMPTTQPNPAPAAPPRGNYGEVKMDYGNGTVLYEDGTVEYANSPGGTVHTRRNADGSVSYNLDKTGSSWTAPTQQTGDQPRNEAGSMQLQQLPEGYANWAGWDYGKLTNPEHGTVKYNAGRLFQELTGGNQYAANQFRGNLQSVADAYNERYGGNARATSDDKIDFGDGAGPVDVITSGGQWWWGNEAAGGAGATSGGYNPYDQYTSQQYGDVLDQIMGIINQRQDNYFPVGQSGGQSGTRQIQSGPIGTFSASDYRDIANFVSAGLGGGGGYNYLTGAYRGGMYGGGGAGGGDINISSTGLSPQAQAAIRSYGGGVGPNGDILKNPSNRGDTTVELNPARSNNVRATNNPEGALPGPQIPQDLQNLRELLGSVYAGNLQGGHEAYPGQFGVDVPYMGAAGQMAVSGVGAVGNALQPGAAMLQSGAGMLQSAAGPISAAIPTALDIAMTGGAPTRQLISSLGDIRNAGQLSMQNNLAQIREQYGAAGAGRGTDVSAALARGAAEGEAAIQASQSSLLTGVLQQAAQTQLGGVSSLLGAGQGLGQLGQGYGQLGQGYGQLAGVLGSQYGQAGQTLTGLAGIQGQLGQFSTQMQYQDWLRRINPSSWMQAATGYASAFPPVMQQPGQGPSTGATLGAAGLAAGGTIMAAILPWIMYGSMMASDKALKEDIEPASDVLPALLSMPIAKWRYKGDRVKHIGPMAQDFNAAFGVGDDKFIHLVDVVGVSLKALSEIGRDVKAIKKKVR